MNCEGLARPAQWWRLGSTTLATDHIGRVITQTMIPAGGRLSDITIFKVVFVWRIDHSGADCDQQLKHLQVEGPQRQGGGGEEGQGGA